MKTETQNKVFYSVKRKELEEYIAQLEADLKHRDDLCAKVTGTIFPGSKFCINYLTLDATEVYNRSKVCVINDDTGSPDVIPDRFAAMRSGFYLLNV